MSWRDRVGAALERADDLGMADDEHDQRAADAADERECELMDAACLFEHNADGI